MTMTPEQHRAEAERLLSDPMPDSIVVQRTPRGYVARRATSEDHANIIALARVHAILSQEKR